MTRPEIDDPDLPLADLFARWPTSAAAFLNRRMLCPGCPVAPFHTVADACDEYRLDIAGFRAEIRRAAFDRDISHSHRGTSKDRPRT